MFIHFRKHLKQQKWNPGRNMNIEALIVRAQKEHVVGNWRKRDPYYIIAGSLVELYPTVMWKAEFINNEFEYPSEEISKQYAANIT